MTGSRLELRWDPDDQRKRVRRSAALTVIVLTALLWALAKAEAPPVTDTTTTTMAIAPSDTATTTTTTTPTVPPQPPVLPTLSLESGAGDFGDQPVGSATEKVITFRNHGTVPFAANAIAFAGARVAAFEVSFDNCGDVSAGASCTTRVVFRPQAVQDEKAQVTLVDKSGTQSDAVTLSGRGTGAPNAPPPPPPPWHHVAFETRLVEVPAGVKVPVSVRNTGEDVATIGSITVDDGKTFNVDQTPCQAKQRLMPGDACEVIVTSNDRTIHVSKLQLVNADKRVEDVASIVNFMFPNRRVEVVNPILQQLQKKGEVRIQPPAKATKIQ